MSIELLAVGIVIILGILLISLILLLIREISRQHSQPRSPSRRPSPRHFAQLDFNQPHPLKARLLNLLNGDQRAASRLLKAAVWSNPGRDMNWYYDKVIRDLIRDRH